MFEKNYLTIAFNILLIKEKEVLPGFISKHNSTCEKKIILMIPNKEKEGWCYFAVKKLFALLHRKSSKRKGDFYFLNCLNSFRTENKLKSHEKVCKNKDFCGFVMPTEKKKILGFNQYMKSDKMPYIIYSDIESLNRKLDGCANNPENNENNENRRAYFLWKFNVNDLWILSYRKQAYIISWKRLYEKVL